MLRRALAVCLLAGLLAGLAIAALQVVFVTPLIRAAEVHEAQIAGDPPAFPQSAHGDYRANVEAWMPRKDIQRILITSFASLVTQAAMWIISGFMVGTVWVWFGQQRAR